MCWWALRRSAWISRLHSPTHLALEDTTHLFYLLLIRMSNSILAHIMLKECNVVLIFIKLPLNQRKPENELFIFTSSSERKAGTGDHECVQSFS
uniref:Beta-ketoacyl-ACP synthase II n=1 Tax=Solanum tuberosum TaxID=4113 RepID=M1C3I9_SOLTU